MVCRLQSPLGPWLAIVVAIAACGSDATTGDSGPRSDAAGSDGPYCSLSPGGGSSYAVCDAPEGTERALCGDSKVLELTTGTRRLVPDPAAPSGCYPNAECDPSTGTVTGCCGLPVRCATADDVIECTGDGTPHPECL